MIEYKISSSCNFGNCVEIGRTPAGGVAVRDSKDRENGPLVFAADEWADFVAGVKNAEFDHI